MGKDLMYHMFLVYYASFCFKAGQLRFLGFIVPSDCWQEYCYFA